MTDSFEKYNKELEESLPEEMTVENVIEAADVSEEEVREYGRRVAAIMDAVEGNEQAVLAHLLVNSMAATGTGDATEQIIDYIETLAEAGGEQ